MKRLLLIGVLLGAAVACGGGGGGGGVPRSPLVGPNTTGRTAAITIVVPMQAGSAVKRPNFIVPGTQSVRIVVYTVNGATPSPEPPATVAQISATAPGCSTVSTGLSCTIDVGVPVSSAVVLEIFSYASTDASGTALASGFIGPINTTVAITTPIGVSLGGVIASITASAATVQATAGPVQTLTFTVSAKDANGNVILPPGAYGTPIAFSASGDTNGAFSFSPNPLTSPSSSGTSTITITYNSAITLPGPVTLKATAGSASATIPTGSGGGGLTAGYRVFEYTIPTSGAKPWGIASDPTDGSVWFTENGTDKVGKLFTSTCTQTATPTCTMIEGAISQAITPTGIAKGQDGNIWIGGGNPAATHHIVVLSVTGACAGSASTTITCTQTPQTDPYNGPGPTVGDVRTSNDGLIHAAMGDGVFETGAYIMSYYPTSVPATQYAAEACCESVTQPFGLTNTDWFTDSTGNDIGYFSCAEGCYIEDAYPGPSGGSLAGIVSAPDGTLYIADQGNNAIQQASPNNCTGNDGCTYNPFPLKTASSLPEFLTIGPDGNVWFTESGSSKIGILNIGNGAITEVTLPTPNAQPYGITLGPDGNIWFTEMGANKIGVIVP